MNIPPSTSNELSREAQVMLYTLGTIADLQAMGFTDGPEIIKPEGRAVLLKLKESGFSPSPDETKWAMEIIRHWQERLS
jgi:hypothetical protein